MHIVSLFFSGLGQPIDGYHITARGLHGLLFNVLRSNDVNEATWLHSHPSPKPFSLVPFYTEDGSLAGLRLLAFNTRAHDLFRDSWERTWKQATPLRLGHQEFLVRQVETQQAASFQALSQSPPGKWMALRFLSPSNFKQGPGALPLPLPANVFAGPLAIWRAFAPKTLAVAVPLDWLDWCEKNVFVASHRINTVEVSISRSEAFCGFVGDVTFEAKDGSAAHLGFWQALGRLATFSGVGRKTNMGMGAVELIAS
jgi:CRISPR-associated endoribonuclease Cas6